MFFFIKLLGESTEYSPQVKNGFLNNHVIISALYNNCVNTKKNSFKNDK